MAFSCKQRCLCPSCHQKRELLWAEWAEEELLAEVPHRQVVLTIPKRLRIFFRFDRRLLGELLGCAWRAWRLWLEASLEGVVEPGGVGFVQTAGELLGWHPHVHLLVTDGGFHSDGSFRHLLWVDGEAVERLWRAEVLRLLVERGKIGPEVVESLLSWRHSGFSVHAGVRVEEKPSAARLGRSMARCPIVLDRLEWDGDREEVVVHPRPSRRGGAMWDSERLDVLDSLARVLMYRPNRQPGREFDAYLGQAFVKGPAEDLDRLLGKPQLAEAKVPFHNGQILETPRSVWLSLLTLERRILELLGADRIPFEDFESQAGVERFISAASLAAAEMEELFGKEVRFVHALPAGDLAAMKGQIMEIGGGAGYDLDSLVTILVRNGDLPAALVGSLEEGRTLLRSMPDAELDHFASTYGLTLRGSSLRARLVTHSRSQAAAGLRNFTDGIARHLAQQGLSLERSPLIVVPYDLVPGSPTGRLAMPHFLIEWNNTVLEQREGISRAEGFSSTLASGDERARQLYVRFGYELWLLPPIPFSVVRNGGYRCSSNELR